MMGRFYIVRIESNKSYVTKLISDKIDFKAGSITTN